MAVTLAVAEPAGPRVHLQLGPGGRRHATGRGLTGGSTLADMAGQIYVNPACSKCRTALSILEERNVQADEVRYLDEPPDRRRAPGPDATARH